VYYWNTDTSFYTCNGCADPIFSTADNSIPSDSPPETVIKIPLYVKTIIAIWAALLLMLLFAFFIMIIYNIRNRMVRAWQPSMLFVILLGGLFGCCELLTIVPVLSTVSCILQSWFSHLSFGFIFSALIIKSWVVNKIFNSKMKRVRVSMKDATINLVLGLVVLTLFLFLITFVGGIHVVSKLSGSVHHPNHDYYCSQKLPLISYILLVMEVLAILVCVRLGWAIRNAPDMLHESKYMIGCKCHFAVS